VLDFGLGVGVPTLCGVATLQNQLGAYHVGVRRLSVDDRAVSVPNALFSQLLSEKRDAVCESQCKDGLVQSGGLSFHGRCAEKAQVHLGLLGAVERTRFEIDVQRLREPVHAVSVDLELNGLGALRRDVGLREGQAFHVDGGGGLHFLTETFFYSTDERTPSPTMHITTP
jgi:hypothetical protein